MNTFLKNSFTVLFVTILAGSFTSCVKKDFENPPDPAFVDPNLVVNLTIAQLKAMDTLAGVPIKITEDYIISGIVVADDKSGNFYKEIIIQDATGGISIQIDQSNYYTDFPVGRKVFVKLRGLYLGEYHHLIQLGGYYTTSGTYYNIERIPQSLISQHIIKGSYFHTVIPKVLKITELDSFVDQNTLVQLSDMQFDQLFVNQPYANGPNLADVNMVLQDCECNSLELRNSDFADFGYKLTPSGNGTITGIFQIYDLYNQIKIRDLADVNMNNGRCGTQGGSTPVFNNVSGYMPLDSVRMFYQGFATTMAAGRVVKGVVISDRCAGNIDMKNIVIQDSTGGIVVRFLTAASFPVGALVSINVGGVELSEYNGLLQLNNVPNTSASYSVRASLPVHVTTIDSVLSNFNKWESTLVEIRNATLSGSGTTYNSAQNFGSLNMDDGTSNTTLYTRSGANFASVKFPTIPVDITGIVSDYNGLQIMMRTIDDVK